MLLKSTILTMSALVLCLIIISARTRIAEEDRRDAAIDQQVLDQAYKQLQKDRKEGNAARAETDQDNIDTAEKDFRTDEQRTIEDDQKIVTEDRRALETLSQQLQQDRAGDTGAVAADEKNIDAAQQKLQADKQQTAADDGLKVTRDQQALDNENFQLQQDLRDNDNLAGDRNTVQADEENVKGAATVLQNAQMKLQTDRRCQACDE